VHSSSSSWFIGNLQWEDRLGIVNFSEINIQLDTGTGNARRIELTLRPQTFGHAFTFGPGVYSLTQDVV
jgi:hypothetical protein